MQEVDVVPNNERQHSPFICFTTSFKSRCKLFNELCARFNPSLSILDGSIITCRSKFSFKQISPDVARV